MPPEEQENTKKGGRKWRIPLLLLFIFLLIIAAALAVSGVRELKEYEIGDRFYADLSQTALPQSGKPKGETAEAHPSTPLSQIDFKLIRRSCPDVVGWIKIDDSRIDYPVVHGEDNSFYLTHFPNKNQNIAGSIMMDDANTGDFTDMVNIIHGHNMKNGSMFGSLEEYREEDFYKTHKVIKLYTPNGDYEARVFAACVVNGDTFGYPTSFSSESEFDNFIRKALSLTPYEADNENLTYGDRILLLSTCAYDFNGARFIVLAKIMY